MVFGLKLGLAGKKAPPAEPPSSNSDVGQAPSSKATSGGKSALTVNEFVARTKRCRERGLEPTKPELIAYARYLGIDPVIDADLMWIVDESLNAPLPSEWTEHHDSAGRVFYYNVHTHTSSWTHPLEQLHRDTYKGIVNFRSGDLTKDEQATELEKLRRKCEEAEREAHKELQAWTEHVDEQGQKFYNNREQQRSYWTDPRPARCHTLYLQMKALRCLSKHCGQPAGGNGRGGSNDAGVKIPELKRLHADLPRGDQAAPSAVATSQKGGGSGGAMSSDDDDRAERKRKKREKKQREADEQNEQNGHGKEELAPLAPPSHVGQKREAAEPLAMPAPSKDPWDVPKASKDPWGTKPNRSHVEEVRSALGVADNSLPPLGMGAQRGFAMGGAGRLPTPPGDGLTNQGRARVKPGIRLEPLKGAA